MSSVNLGTVGRLRLTAAPSAFVSSAALWALLSAVGVWLLELPFLAAVLGGLVAVALHWLGEYVHQWGHAWVARRLGYPMAGVRLWFLLGTSIYPRDEPELPAAIHIRRALGGPAISLLLTLLSGAVVLALRPVGGTAWWVALLFFLENVFIFTLGALMPFPFSDGGTLRRWWPRR